MSDKSKIEWTDATWNPVRGCTKISAGCKHCYAETLAERFRGVAGHPFEFGFDIRLVPHKLEEPLRWRAPRMVFVNSMSDLFHQTPGECILRWGVVLTKVADRLHRMLGGVLAPGGVQKKERGRELDGRVYSAFPPVRLRVRRSPPKRGAESNY